MEKRIHIQSYAVFREARGREAESVTTRAATPRELFDELGFGAAYPSPTSWIKVAVNDDFAPWDAALRDGDTVVFIAPTAGG
jgi:molybdopterin converting factor small subunit